MTPKPRADAVVVPAGLKAEFLKRHRKDLRRANEAWAGLVARRSRLLADANSGEPIPTRKRPARFDGHDRVYLIPELPHRFRALYSIDLDLGTRQVLVVILWIGDHEEYDELFGYRTS